MLGNNTSIMKFAFNAALTAAAAGMFVGCAGSGEGGGMRGLSGSEAENLNAPHTKFDTDKDPPFTADTHYAAGRLAETQGAMSNALEQYKSALAVDPNNQKSLYRMGVLQTQLKMYPAAIETWKKYVKTTNSSPAALSNLAFCYELSGKMDDAEQTYQRGIEADPKSTSCRVNYGLMLARTNRISAATAQLSAVLTPAEVHYNLASIYEQQGRPDEAKSEYQKSIEADPTFKDARLRLRHMQ